MFLKEDWKRGSESPRLKGKSLHTGKGLCEGQRMAEVMSILCVNKGGPGL